MKFHYHPTPAETAADLVPEAVVAQVVAGPVAGKNVKKGTVPSVPNF
jgi:hypothetical protein